MLNTLILSFEYFGNNVLMIKGYSKTKSEMKGIMLSKFPFETELYLASYTFSIVYVFFEQVHGICHMQ